MSIIAEETMTAEEFLALGTDVRAELVEFLDLLSRCGGTIHSRRGLSGKSLDCQLPVGWKRFQNADRLIRAGE